jgi:hypothetical protein
MGKFVKGQSGNRRGRPPGRSPGQTVLWDLKMAARKHCPKALQRIVECLDDANRKIRLLAAQLLLERGYGRPEQHSGIELTHNFVIAPDVMPLDRWLANKGQPERYESLERQQTKPKPLPATIDLRAEEQPEPESLCGS